MALRLTVDVIDSSVNPKTRFPRILFEIEQRLVNWRAFWIRVFLPKYLETVQQNFVTEGELVGGWPDLDPTYAAWKARHFPGTKILERTRRLRSSLQPGATGPDTVLKVGPHSLEVGTRVPWGKFHNATRQFLPPIRKQDYLDDLRDWIFAEKYNAGLRASLSSNKGAASQ